MKAEQLLSFHGEYLFGPLLIKPNIFGDERGFFYESWNQSSWDQLLAKDN